MDELVASIVKYVDKERDQEGGARVLQAILHLHGLAMQLHRHGKKGTNRLNWPGLTADLNYPTALRAMQELCALELR